MTFDYRTSFQFLLRVKFYDVAGSPNMTVPIHWQWIRARVDGWFFHYLSIADRPLQQIMSLVGRLQTLNTTNSSIGWVTGDADAAPTAIRLSKDDVNSSLSHDEPFLVAHGVGASISECLSSPAKRVTMVWSVVVLVVLLGTAC